MKNKFLYFSIKFTGNLSTMYSCPPYAIPKKPIDGEIKASNPEAVRIDTCSEGDCRLSLSSLPKQREKSAILNDVWRRLRGWLSGHRSTAGFAAFGVARQRLSLPVLSSSLTISPVSPFS